MDSVIQTTSLTDFEHFFRMSIDVMLISDLEGNIIEFNQALEKISGYSKDELLNLNSGWGIIHPEDLTGATDQIQKLKNAQSLYNYKFRIICKSGDIKFLSYDAVIDKRKGLIYAIGRDVTDQQVQQNLLQQKEARLKSILQNTTFGILLIDYNGKIIEANNTLIERLGYKENEFGSFNLQDILFKEDEHDAIGYFKNLLDGHYDNVFSERRFKRYDGTAAWSHISCSKIILPGDEKLILAVVEDIDSIKRHKKALMESEEKFRTVFESSPMGIVITKLNGDIVEVNPAVADMFGFEKPELIGKNIISFSYAGDHQKSKRFMNKIRQTDLDEFTIEKRYIKKDGKIFWAKTVISKMTTIDGEKMSIAIIENIEKNKKTEQTLEQKNKELTQINQELENFAYVASHDLQEPLRTITSFIQILEKKYSNKLDKNGLQFMGFVVEGAKRMQTLIHDLLEYSRINRFNNAYEKVDLNDVFTTVNRVLKEKIEINDALVMSENLPTIYGSKLQLTQMFQNLIDNAIKFRGKKKPEILISVKNLNDKWEIIFKDNGIGISQEYFQRIFVIFQRLHTLEEYGGTGIGLAICKKIVERHGGDIWVESNPGKGSVFHLTLAKNLMAPIN